MSLYALHFKYQDQYHISRTHLQRWITAYQESGIGALKPFSPKSWPTTAKIPSSPTSRSQKYSFLGAVQVSDGLSAFIEKNTDIA